jgi:hypothetical protein
MTHPNRLCINCSELTDNPAFCDRCLNFDSRPQHVIAAEQDELYRFERSEWNESLPRGYVPQE